MWDTRARGFAIVDLLRVMAAGGLVALVVAMAALPAERGSERPKEKDRVIAVIDAAASAVRQQIVDTGRAAREHVLAPGDAVELHELTMAGRRAGWRGPYLSHELVERLRSSPFVTRIDHAFDRGSAPIDGRFVLWTDEGRVEQRSGSYLVLDGVSASLAREIDRDVDPTDADWARDGRVQWLHVGSGRLIVLLLKHG